MSAPRASLAALLLLAGIATSEAATVPKATPDIVHMLAPSGELHAALYVGTPTSVLSETDRRGVGYELGEDLAAALGVPYKPRIFAKNAEVLAAVKTANADVAFTNASPERAAEMDFSQPYLAIELGYLAAPKTKVAAIADVDKPGVKVGVTANSSSDGYLSSHLTAATVVREATFEDGIRQMAAGDLDVYATNKASLFEMAETLPGAHVLDGGWGAERHGVAIPKGRAMALPFLKAFVAAEIESGRVASAVAHAGLRGTLPAGAE
jgi:polar amino acid transport system substrate-binding protein